MEYKTKSNLREVLGQKPPGPPKIPHCWGALGAGAPPIRGRGVICTGGLIYEMILYGV